LPSRALGAGRCAGAPYADARPDGTHTGWSAPQALPAGPDNPTGVTYVLPHVTPDGTIYTTLTNFTSKKGFCCVSVLVDKSADGGTTLSVAGTAVSSVTPPSAIYPNTRRAATGHPPQCSRRRTCAAVSTARSPSTQPLPQ
jgi:hypothetical protein